MKFYHKRSFWLLALDTVVAVVGILLPLMAGAEFVKYVAAVWAACQPMVIYIIKEWTVDDAAKAGATMMAEVLREVAALKSPEG